MLKDDAAEPRVIQESVIQAVKTYIDRYIRQKQREIEFEYSEPGYLDKDKHLITHYSVRVKESRFLQHVKNIFKKPMDELEHLLLEEDSSEPLPRLHIQHHLYNPILISGKGEWKERVSVSPPALNKDEKRLLEDIRKFWAQNHENHEYKDIEIYILRNLPKSGVGLFAKSGFYPDFILWIKNNENGHIHVRFLDPHGLHHDGLKGSVDKFAALNKLKEFSNRKDFKQNKITLDGFVLTSTELTQIPDREDRTWTTIETEFPVRRFHSDYVKKLFSTP